jgi:hypothetical protein
VSRVLVPIALSAALAVSGCAAVASRSVPAAPAAGPTVIPKSDLCVTAGKVRRGGEDRLEVRSPAMRAVVTSPTLPAAELGFVYRGPTAETARLASGELRRQIGLKLRAQDSCNVVYVMWRIEPSSRLVVSVKQNPGQSRHAECGDRGYRNVKPERSARLPEIRAGEPHVLRAAMHGDRLEVRADGDVVWTGSLGGGALGFDGPVGVRTDNGVFELSLRAEPSASGATVECSAARASSD